MKSRLVSAPKLWPAQEHHARRPDWTELFFDLVFAAAINQLSTPLGADFTFHGALKYAFLLALVLLAWFGYTAFSTRYATDDVVQHSLTILQVFLVAVMAANSTGALSSKDAAGFGAAYGGVRAILALQYVRVRKLGTPPVGRRITGLLTASVIWAGSALLPAPSRYVGWAIAFFLDFGNSWLPVRATTAAPPGATHFPERFGLLTIILLGEFVASVLRGIESQQVWSVPAASAAVISLVLGFAIWSGYSDGAKGWEARHVRSHGDVIRLRIWIALHAVLFLGIGIMGVGVRRAIALPPGAHFSIGEQAMICSATAGIIFAIMGIAATTETNLRPRRNLAWLGQGAVALLSLFMSPLAPQMMASLLPLGLLLCLLGQTAILVASRRGSPELGENV